MTNILIPEKIEKITLDIDILIDTDTAAQLLSIQPSTLAKWRSTGEHHIQFVRIGRSVRYRTCDLRHWIESNSERGGAA